METENSVENQGQGFHAHSSTEKGSTIPENYVPGVHPWRRFFARGLDNMINVGLLMFVVGVLFAILAPDIGDKVFGIFEGPAGRIVDIIVTLFFAMFLNGLWIASTGSSIGKWIMGIYVSTPDGKRIDGMTALRREAHLWMRGYGFGIPLVSLVTLIVSYNRLEERKVTSWDEAVGTVVRYRPEGALQYVLTTVGALLYFATIAGAQLLAVLG